MVFADRHARRDQRDSADKIEPTLAAEPTEKTEATEATEPIERTDPAEPMHRIEPTEPIDKIDPLDPMLRSEPAEPADRELSLFLILGFSHHWPISGMTGWQLSSSARPVSTIKAPQAAQVLNAVRPAPMQPVWTTFSQVLVASEADEATAGRGVTGPARYWDHA